MGLIEAYIWIDCIIEKLKKDIAPDTEIEALELSKRFIREKFTGYADNTVKMRGKETNVL